MTFRIPAHWKEEYEPEGGGTFYEDTGDSATFRLQTMTFKAPSPLTAEFATNVLLSLREAATTPIERLPNGCALIRYAQSGEDRGHRLLITYWSVAQIVPPNHARIANFSYTIHSPTGLSACVRGVTAARNSGGVLRSIRMPYISPDPIGQHQMFT